MPCQILMLGKEVFHPKPELSFMQSDLFLNVQSRLLRKYPVGGEVQACIIPVGCGYTVFAGFKSSSVLGSQMTLKTVT